MFLHFRIIQRLQNWTDGRGRLKAVIWTRPFGQNSIRTPKNKNINVNQ